VGVQSVWGMLWKEPIEGEGIYRNKLDVCRSKCGQGGWCRGEREDDESVTITIEGRGVLSRLSVCSSGGLEEVVRMYKSRHFHHPKFLTMCFPGERHDGSAPKSRGREKFPTHSSSSSEIDSNDEVLPWLLLLLLDPPPEEAIKGDGFAV